MPDVVRQRPTGRRVLARLGAYSAGAAWLFVEPTGELAVADAPRLWRLGFFVLGVVVVVIVSARLRSALHRERTAHAAAQRELAGRLEAERTLREREALHRAASDTARSAEAAVRRHAGQIADLQRLTAALSAARTTDEVAAAVFHHALPLVGARAGSVSHRAGDDQLALLYSEGVAEDARRDYEVTSLGAPLPTAETARTGEPIFLCTAAEIAARYPHLAEASARWGDRAWACLPLVSEGRVQGVLGLSYRDERTFDFVERAMALSVAQLCADAFARARRYEAEQAARRRAEAAEDEAKRALTAGEQVVSVVGHDLRTPLSAITMAATLLRRTATDDRQRDAAERIARSAARMSAIIRDLLDLSRARRGVAIALSPEPLDAADVCRLVVGELEDARPGSRVDVHAEGDLRVHADPARLQQAVSNLVANALQHGARDRPVSVRASAEPHEVHIAVHNHGAAIPPALLPHLFEPFQRGDAADDAGGSLGLGLFIVQEIARAHRGTVEVSSAEEHGTTFTLRLPRGRAEAAVG